jgi:ABC-2 type transport system ATP-binding protein
MSASPILEISQLAKSFKAPVLADINISIQPGESVALVGANGAGKSTLIKIILGLMNPSAGSIKLFGSDPFDAESRRRVGYLPEMPGYWSELSARELLKFIGQVRRLAPDVTQKRSENLLNILGLKLRGSRLMGGYSKGMLQRTGVSQALLHDPDFIILDEPMSGLDPRAQEKLRVILQKLRDKGKTLLISSHALDDIRSLTSRVIVLEKTRVVSDGPTHETLEALVQRYRSSEPWDEDPLGEVPDVWSLDL